MSSFLLGYIAAKYLLIKATCHFTLVSITQTKVMNSLLLFHGINKSSLTGSPSIASFVLNRTTKSLICNSSGGPATKTTWMKNNLPLSIDGNHYRQHQTVVDSANAVYVNTLYSDDLTSLVGTFTCTVENLCGMSTKSISINGENVAST